MLFRSAGLFARENLSGVIRAIEPLSDQVPPQWTVQLERPPFSFQHELELLRQHAITHILTKNAGGGQTATKLLAARALHIQVIMIVRPIKASTPCCSTVDELLVTIF